MKIAFIAAGAANMYCGSCLRDNAVAKAMLDLGHDSLLIPLYTPMRLERDDVSIDRIFYGGISIYMQEKAGFFRKSALFDKFFNSRSLLNLSSKFADLTRPEDLGALTISTLKGERGKQRRELENLARWLADEIKPDIINLPNAMFVGTARELAGRTGAPIICSLTGENLFIEGLIEPYKSEAMRLLREGAKHVDGFIAISRYYAGQAAAMLEIPEEKIAVAPLGIEVKGFGRKGRRPIDPYTIGYLARISTEKGLHVLIDAFCDFKKLPGTERARLRVAGYLGPKDRPYFEKAEAQIHKAGLADTFEYVGEVTFEGKLRFLDSLSVLSTPTVYPEPKGLFVLEALAHGVPVVQPAHGAFPELIEATGGGLLYDPAEPGALVRSLQELMNDPDQADRLAHQGRTAIHDRFTAEHMARATIGIYEKYL